MAFPCQLDDEPATVGVDADALTFGSRSLPWVDVDAVRLVGPDVVLELVGGGRAVVSHLARQHDEFVLALRAADWARRAALLQWTGDAPIDEYDAFAGDEPVRVVLFRDGITVEADAGVPAMAPFALVTGVTRDGYSIEVALRSGEPVRFGRTGRRTDELLVDIDTAMRDWRARTAAVYAELGADGLDAPGGWAVDRAGAGPRWGALRAAVASGERAAEIAVLESLAGDSLRLGIAPLPGGGAFPFVLAPARGKVAVEGADDEEARATFVFATDDVDRLNAVLLLTSFRREAISLPDDRLGRWALAVRSLDVVRWARDALVARVVHDDNWEGKVRGSWLELSPHAHTLDRRRHP